MESGSQLQMGWGETGSATAASVTNAFPDETLSPLILTTLQTAFLTTGPKLMNMNYSNRAACTFPDVEQFYQDKSVLIA